MSRGIVLPPAAHALFGSTAAALSDIHVDDEPCARSHARSSAPALTWRDGQSSVADCQLICPLLHLPFELVVLVLSHLDAKSMSRFAATCRAFFNGPMNPVLASLVVRAASLGRVSPATPSCGFSSLALQLAWLECRRDEAWMPVAAGWSCSFFVAGSGRLMSCGTEAVGQRGVLGHGAENRELGSGFHVIAHPMCLPTMDGIRINRVSAGSGFCIAVSVDGSVYTWGKGNYGCLGNSTTEDSHIPVQLRALGGIRVISAAAGHFHCLVATEEGHVYSWGHAQFGRCGHCRSPGNSNGLWQVEAQPRRVLALEGVRARSVAAADYHSLVVTESGALYSFGYGAHGRVYHGRDEDECLPSPVDALGHVHIVAAVTGGRHSVALTEDGTVFAWGKNSNGELGLGSIGRNEHLPRCVDTLCGVSVVTVAVGFACSYAVSRGGELFAWGNGESGQLGHGDVANQPAPRRVDALQGECVVVISPGHRESTVAVTRTGGVFGWGTAKGYGLPAAAAAFENAYGVVCSSLPCRYPRLSCVRCGD